MSVDAVPRAEEGRREERVQEGHNAAQETGHDAGRREDDDDDTGEAAAAAEGEYRDDPGPEPRFDPRGRKVAACDERGREEGLGRRAAAAGAASARGSSRLRGSVAAGTGGSACCGGRGPGLPAGISGAIDDDDARVARSVRRGHRLVDDAFAVATGRSRTVSVSIGCYHQEVQRRRRRHTILLLRERVRRAVFHLGRQLLVPVGAREHRGHQHLRGNDEAPRGA
mmetsp:Transcript_17170/g.41168  ORF Transcript_17170/g.41168 Transcript_17170/m.41168 type:complete len:225 (+) Transcript_17170:140-814(+)